MLRTIGIICIIMLLDTHHFTLLAFHLRTLCYEHFHDIFYNVFTKLLCSQLVYEAKLNSLNNRKCAFSLGEDFRQSLYVNIQQSLLIFYLFFCEILQLVIEGRQRSRQRAIRYRTLDTFHILIRWNERSQRVRVEAWKPYYLVKKFFSIFCESDTRTHEKPGLIHLQVWEWKKEMKGQILEYKVQYWLWKVFCATVLLPQDWRMPSYFRRPPWWSYK